MTAPNPPELLPVTQADRKAAADAILDRLKRGFGVYEEWMDQCVGPILQGRYDDDAEVQAFARHRIASEAAAEKLAGAAKPFARDFRAAGPDDGSMPDDAHFARWDGHSRITLGDLRNLRDALAQYEATRKGKSE